MDPAPLPRPAFTGALPQRLGPMLAAERAEPFDSPDHIFEVYWSGARVMVSVDGGRVTLRSRNHQDLTPYFPEIAALLHKRVHGNGVMLDGVLTTPDAKGVPRLSGLARRLYGRDEEARSVPVNLQLFDVLYKEARPLLRYPLLRRKELLRETVDPDEQVQLSHFEQGAGIPFFEAATRLGLPGMVAKERTSLYQPGRREAWLQVLAGRETNLVIGGYTLSEGANRREPFAALILGAPDAQGLRYKAAVSGGFSGEEMEIVGRLLQDGHTHDCPFVDPPKMGRLLYWVQPEVVARVSFGEASADGRLQFAIFKGLRPDLDPADCAALSVA